MLNKIGMQMGQDKYINPLQSPATTDKLNDRNVSGEKNKSINGIGECQTCKNRKYQDSSGDPGVSMKSPTNLSPAQAATAVFSHEREHYTRENAKAAENNRDVLSNQIRIFTAVCPECGKVYVSGGETSTVTRAKQEQEPSPARSERAEFAKQFFDKTIGDKLPKVMNVQS